MSARERIEEAGGVLTRAELLALMPRSEVDAALRRGEVLSDGRAHYTTPATGDAVRAAHALNGVLCLASAALHHGWGVLRIPDRPQVMVPRKRTVGAARRAGVEVHWRDLTVDEVAGIATAQEATLLHCLTRLPFAEALAIADSALRAGVTPSTLRRVAMTARGPGAPRARQVARAASAESANPFESALRAIALEVPGLRVQPQRVVVLAGGDVRPDLVDEDLRIVHEADSFAWHGGREALARDAHRYNRLVAAGWLVLRFSWEQVFRPEEVRAVLVAVVATRPA